MQVGNLLQNPCKVYTKEIQGYLEVQKKLQQVGRYRQRKGNKGFFSTIRKKIDKLNSIMARLKYDLKLT